MNFIKKIFKKEKKEIFVDDTDKNTIFEHTETKLGRYSNYGIFALILISVFLVMFESLGNNGEKYLVPIFVTDAVISVLFGIEYIYRYTKSDEKKKFFFRITNIFDLLSFLPFIVISLIFGMGNYAIFKLFRIFRVFKIFELFSHIPILLKLSKGIYKHRIEYLASIIMIFIVLIFFSTAIYYTEHYFNPNNEFTSVPATLWWGVVTMTTVGYGDMVPHTVFGKILGGILMFLGPVIITLLSTITAFVFLESTKLLELGRVVCSECGTENAKNSNFCKHCAYKINKKI